MSIKDHAIIVSLSVSKPQMTQKDDKATRDAEQANNAHGAGQFRKDLYPKSLIAPILAVESSCRAFIESTTYPWTRGERLLPTVRFMNFIERIGQYEVEFSQNVTVFLNNWANVMAQAQSSQGSLFDAGAYPDLTNLRSEFRFRIVYTPVTDQGDFRVQMQEEELDALRTTVEAATKESMESMLRAPLERLRAVVAKLNDVAGKQERNVIDKKTGLAEAKPPIFRDSVVENISEEINLLHDFAEMLPDNIVALAKDVVDAVPHPQLLRDDPAARAKAKADTDTLLAAIDELLG